MQHIDALISARWILPVEPRGRLLEDHAVAVHRGRIVAVAPRARARAEYAAREETSFDDHVLVPGLVNAHTHAAMSLFKGMADDMPLMIWLKEHIWPAEMRWASEAFVRDGTRLAAAEMIRSGTTCFNDMYFYPEDTARVAAECGIRAVVGLIVLDFPTVWAKDADEYIAKGVEVHDRFRDDPLIGTAFAPHAPYSVSDEPLERVRTLSDELAIPVHMHVHESAFEVEESVRERAERPLGRLARLGLLSDRLVAVHMTQLEDAEIEAVARAGAAVVHCPESNLKLANGFCPVERLLEAGATVALGTDSSASNNDLDMLGELRTGSLLAKGVAGSATALDAARTLEMATLGGARALGLDEEIGSLVPGKAADIVAIDLGTLETRPVYSPLSQIVYAANRQLVTDVWIAGRRVLKDRELLTVDAVEVVAVADEWRARIAGSQGAPQAQPE